MLFRNDKKDPGRRRRQLLRVPLLPLRDIIVFPHMVVPLFVGRQKSIRALEEAMNKQKFILLAAQKRSEDQRSRPRTTSTASERSARVVQLLRLPDGTVKVLVEGKKRARSLRYVDQRRLLPRRGRGDRGERATKTTEIEALIRSDQLDLRALRQAEQEDSAGDDHVGRVDRRPGPPRRHDRRAPRHQARGQAGSARDRSTRPSAWRRCSGYMRSEIEILEVEKRIRTRVKKQMEKTQKEYYLNEQMRAIQKELGEKDEFKNEIQELEEKIKQKKMSAEAQEKAEKELKKLKMMSPMSAEATVVRNYIDWIISLPWHEYTEDKLDISEAETRSRGRPLRPREGEAAHPRVPRRAERWSASMKGPILCLVGPPGVGKTSLGKSIARATGPEVRARVARRRARRGRDPRPPAHLHRRPPGQDHPVDEEGGLGEPGLPARRGRQDVDRLPRRSVVGAPRGPRSRAELRRSTITTSTSTTISRR